jgi:3',5'-cyclic AMP phosphodiesterase CpdA
MEDPLEECYLKRIDYGNVHFIVLDVEWELAAYTTEQKAWLERQLADIPGEDWIVVMSHTFYYSSGSHMDGWNWYDNDATIKELVPLFEENGVDIVLSGHKHHSEVLEKNGITYVVAGSFGGVQNPERTYVSPASIWYKQGQYGFVDITIRNSTDATLVFRDPEFNEIFRKEVKQRE